MSLQRAMDAAEEARLRREYAALIVEALRVTATAPPIEIHLALGGACKAVTPRQRQIWREEIGKRGRWIDAPVEERRAAVAKKRAKAGA
jgi:hypothetical protein